MLVTLFGIVTLVRLLQLENAIPPMLVTLSGIVTFFRFGKDRNALSRITVTAFPLWIAGISTSVRYFVVPPLTA